MASPDVLWEKYDYVNWWLDRVGNMEFLADQLFGTEESVSKEFAETTYSGLMRYNFMGYII